MELIHVDQAKCVRCGLCSKVCPVGIIHMTGQGPYYQGGHCIVCGHCVAVCPTAALDHRRAPLANQLPLPKQPVLNADTAACFLRARRSIRVYKDMRVPRQQIAELLDIARFAPTAGNTQGVSYYIFDQPETLRQVTALIIAWMETEISNVSPWAPYYTGRWKNTVKQAMILFCGGHPVWWWLQQPKSFWSAAAIIRIFHLRTQSFMHRQSDWVRVGRDSLKLAPPAAISHCSICWLCRSI